MPANNRQPATLTRSLSFRYDVLAAADVRAEALRTDRSTFINGVLEHMLGIFAHPELVGRNVAFVEDHEQAWAGRARELERLALKERAAKRDHQVVVRAGATPVGGIVKRPARGR